MILSLDFDCVLHPQYEKQRVPADVVFCNLPRFEAVMRTAISKYIDILLK